MTAVEPKQEGQPQHTEKSRVKRTHPPLPGVDTRATLYHPWYDALIRVHNDAVADLRVIREVSPEAAAKLTAFIQQLRADKALISRLLDDGFGDGRNEPLSVAIWVSVKRIEKLPLWRLRAWDLERQDLKYRIVYCYNWRDRSYNIMAIVPRDEIDYDDPSNPLRKRIIASVRREFPGC